MAMQPGGAPMMPGGAPPMMPGGAPPVMPGGAPMMPVDHGMPPAPPPYSAVPGRPSSQGGKYLHRDLYNKVFMTQRYNKYCHLDENISFFSKIKMH